MVRKSYDELLSNTIKRQRDKYDFKSVEDIKNMNYPLDKEFLQISYLREYFVNVEELEKYLRSKFESDNNILEKALTDGKSKSIRTKLINKGIKIDRFTAIMEPWLINEKSYEYYAKNPSKTKDIKFLMGQEKL